MKISEALKQIINNPDDLTQLPSLIEKVVKMEEGEESLLTRIGKLQDLNKQYLSQIPLSGETTEEEEEEEEKEITDKDIEDTLVSILGGK